MKQSIINDIVTLLNDEQESFEAFEKELHTKFPVYSQHEVEYWASRLVLLGANPDDRWELEQDDLDEPTKITITLYPTYGS